MERVTVVRVFPLVDFQLLPDFFTHFSRLFQKLLDMVVAYSGRDVQAARAVPSSLVIGAGAFVARRFVTFAGAIPVVAADSLV